MKQALHLRLGQHLTMTPQLQQAIKLLQLSALELQTEVQEALDSNMMLEVAEDGHDDESNPSQAAEERNKSTGEDESLIMQQEAIPSELPVDSGWDDIYEPVTTASSSNREYDVREFDIPDSAGGESLQDHLIWQMEMTHFSDTDRIIAETIIDAINEDGYFAASLEEIQQALTSDELEIDIEEVEAVLHRIQHFDPPGIAARNLQENLLIQLKQLPFDVDRLEHTVELVQDHFDLLANRDFAQLMRRMKITEEELKEIVQLIQTLQPRPGSQITNSKPEYIVPDVIVKKIKNRWVVELNPDAAPKLRVNNHYASLIKQVHNDADNTYMKNQLQEARWFIKSLQSRNETLLKVSRCIVERQQGFLEHGEEAMKALVLHDVAEEVEMHESTISRVTTKKYMYTPRGIFELKYFFSSHVTTASGGECSATAIRALIKKLIAAEKPNKPLSDSKLASILEDQGINVARRTVAKYREAMGIPPSNERKRLT
ncbi:MAG: RNA polymerase factor sigma-54 [Gammaproteobacteria bacterium]|nr:RNA polymerase factor sigma-54 [Gammaproteobacteria bacterium]MDH5653647.1 RNA polymerase factor sigma-54 [Gammaproteobacteria bacterium]